MKPNHEFRLVFAVATSVGVESYMTEAMLWPEAVAMRRACPRPEIVQVVTDTRSSRRNQAAGDEIRVPMVLACGSQCTLRLWRQGNPQVRLEANSGRESSGVSGKVAGMALSGVIRSLLEVVTCLFAAYGFVALVAGN